tara:strand:- start:4784 stop:5590 length:807 start_codon:yes stop_codon:yes gene_type:complete
MPREHTVVITPYLNTRAFVHHGAPDGCRLRALPPREAQAAIASGSALAGVVPVGGLRPIKPLVNYLGPYGIACAGPVDSVLFFSRRPLRSFDATCRVALTDESMTSVRLLYLLFSYAGCALPRAVRPGDDAEGELAIGDRALQLLHSGDYLYVLDLAEAWYAHHQLPMVFARWVIRWDAPRAVRSRLHEWLAAFARNETALLEQAARRDCARAGLDPATALNYLQRIRTVLQPDDLVGQRTYEGDLARHGHFGFLDMPDPATLESIQV